MKSEQVLGFCGLYPALFLFILFLTSNCAVNREKMVNDLFQDYRGDDMPGAAVMVIQNERPVLKKAFGMADRENKIPVTSQTNFRLASVTKQFTALCIMMLVERGELELGTTLTEIWPDFPAYGSGIMIRNILQHTSGLIAYESIMPDTATIQVTDEDVLQMMIGLDSTYFEPGTTYRYSNSGYAVLARVIEEKSGMSFAGFLHENIFVPLQMNHTVAYQKGISEVANRAFGYRVEGDSITFSDQSPTSAVLGDGGIYSSVDDLFKWRQSIGTDRFVSRAMLAEAFTPHLETYGFGWRIDTYNGCRRVHHTGSTSGFRNVIQHFPDENFTVIILTNRAEPDVAPLAEKLTDWYLLDR